jgi:hypothetical protein
VGDVDAILCCLQGSVEEISSVRFRALSMWMGVGGYSRSQFRYVGGEQAEGLGIAVAKLIEFYVPEGFRPRTSVVPVEHRGRVIEFRPRNVDASGEDKDDLWRKFILFPLRSVAIDAPPGR